MNSNKSYESHDTQNFSTSPRGRTLRRPRLMRNAFFQRLPPREAARLSHR